MNIGYTAHEFGVPFYKSTTTYFIYKKSVDILWPQYYDNIVATKKRKGSNFYG